MTINYTGEPIMPIVSVPVYEVYIVWEALNDYCEEAELPEEALLCIARENVKRFNWVHRDVDYGKKWEQFPKDSFDYDKGRVELILDKVKNICSYCKGYHNDSCYISNARKALETILFGKFTQIEMKTFGEFLVSEQLLPRDNIDEAYLVQKKTNLHFGSLCIALEKMTPMQVVEILADQKRNPKLLGQIAMEKGYMSREDVDYIIAFRKERYLYIGQVLIALGYLTEEQLKEYLKKFNNEITP